MVEEPQTDRLSPRRKAGCREAVGIARRQAAGRLVVGDTERGTAESENAGEGVTDRDESAVGRAVCKN